MDPKTFQEYQKERYEPQIKWYDEKANLNRKLYRMFQWPLIVLSAVTPVLVALGGERTRWVAVGVSVLVAIGTTGLKTFQYQELWLNYRTTCETLRKEMHYYLARVGAYANVADPEAVFVERVEALISRENTIWVTTTKEQAHISQHRQRLDGDTHAE